MLTHTDQFQETAARFNYPACFVTKPEYTAHAGQLVQVLRPCTADEADGPDQDCEQMYLIRAKDGWEGHAFESELEFPVAAEAA